MNIYTFDDAGRFLSTCYVDEERELQPHETRVPPPAVVEAGKIARWNGEVWAITPLNNDEQLRDVRQSRKFSYPPIGDQLDAIWKILATIAPDHPMVQKIQAVKAQLPKPPLPDDKKP